LVAEAWKLYWESCRRLQSDHREVTAYHAHLERLDNEPEGAEEALPTWVPVPKKYPVTHLQVEALLLPKLKGRTAGRADRIREYLFFQLARTCLVVRPRLAALSYWEMEADLLKQLRVRMKDEIDRHFEKFRKTVFDEEAYARFAVSFLQWHRRYLAAKKAAAARKRWGTADEAQNGPVDEPRREALPTAK
jgi:hypothetical protein